VDREALGFTALVELVAVLVGVVLGVGFVVALPVVIGVL
jgi:hypothetical protein